MCFLSLANFISFHVINFIYGSYPIPFYYKKILKEIPPRWSWYFFKQQLFLSAMEYVFINTLDETNVLRWLWVVYFELGVCVCVYFHSATDIILYQLFCIIFSTTIYDSVFIYKCCILFYLGKPTRLLIYADIEYLWIYYTKFLIRTGVNPREYSHVVTSNKPYSPITRHDYLVILFGGMGIEVGCYMLAWSQ